MEPVCVRAYDELMVAVVEQDYVDVSPHVRSPPRDQHRAPHTTGNKVVRKAQGSSALMSLPLSLPTSE